MKQKFKVHRRLFLWNERTVSTPNQWIRIRRNARAREWKFAWGTTGSVTPKMEFVLPIAKLATWRDAVQHAVDQMMFYE